MSVGRAALACFLLLLLLLTAHAQPPVAVAGRLELPRVPAQPVPLQGHWGFAWQRFLDPDWQQLPTRDFTPVPANWNDVTAAGKPPGAMGWGSYVLQVDCPRGQSLAVEAMGQRTASRLFVNGELVASHGQPGPAPAQSWAAVHNRTPITRELPCPLRLTLHVSNFDHRAGGFVRPLLAGSEQVLVRERESRLIHHAALVSAYLLTGTIALIFFVVRRRERVPLVYGLFCLCMALYADLTGERVFLRGLAPQVAWLQFMRAEYLSWIASMALFLATLRGLFPREFRQRLVQALLATLAVAALCVVVLPPAVYSHAAVPGQAISVLVAAYVAASMWHARRQAPPACWRSSSRCCSTSSSSNRSDPGASSRRSDSPCSCCRRPW